MKKTGWIWIILVILLLGYAVTLIPFSIDEEKAGLLVTPEGSGFSSGEVTVRLKGNYYFHWFSPHVFHGTISLSDREADSFERDWLLDWLGLGYNTTHYETVSGERPEAAYRYYGKAFFGELCLYIRKDGGWNSGNGTVFVVNAGTPEDAWTTAVAASGKMR